MNSVLADALLADGPNPTRRDVLMQFGQFEGSWDLDITFFDGDGIITRQVNGEWHFGWALEGRAIIDVWIVPPRTERTKAGPPAGEYGMSVRFFDPSIDAWRSTWIGPVNGVVLPFLAHTDSGDMVLDREENSIMSRWKFSEIEADSFTWENLESRDSGQTWLRIQLFKAVRQI